MQSRHEAETTKAQFSRPCSLKSTLMF